MKSEKILAIDDCRELSHATVLCRTVKAGIEAIKRLGPWDVLYLDHDMGALERQYTETGKELNGYDVLCFPEEHTVYTPKKIVIVTDNAAVRIKMEQLAKKLTGGNNDN